MPWSKESRQSRGYGPEWEKIRKVAIERDQQLCQPCLKKGFLTEFYAVDHIMSKARAKKAGWSEARYEALSNLQCICEACHTAKTIEETGKVYRPKPRIGLDGYPVDE